MTNKQYQGFFKLLDDKIKHMLEKNPANNDLRALEELVGLMIENDKEDE
ncbi:MAG: hypothetical protein IJV16_06110 [Lachnospiraceae bacterium]|nr:hypothetical protein [Lachnospiraceae bacterium]